ncbi:restriction endonuclease subunit S [Candidatus Venteria ishoeyi]|uniref:EcoKI restriction-modification system protein HsdS n=1 Tax=Candidatus Venteria ishoeyi TaxID=1899563 RepID=A0A1H6F2Z2_9GAMM|nr:restriction endonuclease subunit S [Candidatus Venteria ishoeyi]SEH04490.1 EcoKI restriction-modification system protein HsdS [Candidatus Venteria ishoeyi]
MSEIKIDLNNLNKSNWKTYRFDEIAKNISERVDPNNTDLKIYIGLEHIDSESLHIKRQGTPDDVNGQKLKFYKNDIIFGRRRAYQRKAGIATWDGFCSAHALVLRANPEVIDPELFPFFMHSDLFMNRAIDISVGSLSPTINWGTLKHQEFMIPPKDQYEKLAHLLWTAEGSIENLRQTHVELCQYKECLNKKHFEAYRKSPNRVGMYTSKVGSGVTPKGGSKVYQESGVQFIRSQNVLLGSFDMSDVAYISEEIHEKMSSSKVLNNDVLLNITGASIGRSAIYKSGESANVNQHVCILRTIEEELDPLFLSEFINSAFGQKQIPIITSWR